MEIIAIIPAKSGSKGVPNKNVRLLAGKPMVMYAIENALKSNYITKTIVISDSDEIRTIAEQSGVEFVHEEDSLCGDRITLDEVICEAIREEKFDFAVTLQVTSPTLKVETLDKAIEYAISSGFETVISAVNHPKLGWFKDENGNMIPDYKARLNRQFLPEHYIETGAFVIARKDVFRYNTRFGNNVSVFEISEDESIDIDNFSDFVVAENILNKKKIAIIVNGNNEMGMGHIYRMLDLADMFYDKPTFYYDSQITDARSFGETKYELCPYVFEEELIDNIENNQFDIVINDILNTNESYITKIRETSCRPYVVNFEDLGSGASVADVVINALYAEDRIQDGYYGGEAYYIVPRMFTLFQPIKIKEKIANVFISFGGADPQNYTDQLLDVISSREFEDINFTVVLGRAKKNVESLLNRATDNIRVLYNVSSIAKLMTECDVAITSRGRTCYELAYLGIPTISISQNKIEKMHKFVSEQNGYCCFEYDDYCASDILKKVFGLSYHERKEMQKKMLRVDLGKGRNRVRDIILDL